VSKSEVIAMKRVGIVICNFNKKDKVLECIQCILEQKYTDFDIYVVDNASTDGAAEAICGKFEGVSVVRNSKEGQIAEDSGAKSVDGSNITLIVNSENLGGSGGFNTGLRAAFAKGYELLMCVDNDAFLDENAVGGLVEFLDSHPEVGMAASKIYHTEAPDYIQNFGQKIDFENFCTEVPYLNVVEDGTMPDFLYVNAVPACSLMIRRTTVEKIGFMPEENFLYWDDTEWCYLCNQAGMKVASVGTSKALHAMGAKKEDVNTFPTYYGWRNWIRFFMKYTPREEWERMTKTFLDSAFYEVYSGLHRGEFNRMKTVMLAYDDAINGVTGKAGDNRIFDIDFNEEPFKRMFSKNSKFYIEENNHHGMAEWLRGLGDVQWMNAPAAGVTTISLCDSIFRLNDMSLKKIYVDMDGCILQDEDDALDVINFNYSKRAFIAAQQPVFLEKIEKLRG
jgi:hypothetical protein